VGDLPKQELQTPVTRISSGPRISVSAESYGRWNKKESFVHKVVQKTTETKKKIRERLNTTFMFSALDE